MKSVLLVLAFASTCLAAPPSSACYKSFEGYLGALYGEITANPAKCRELEIEFTNDYLGLCSKCFSPSGDGKCALTEDELHADVCGDSGPLKGCDRCQSMCKGFKEKYLHSSEATRVCFRKHLTEGIKDELLPCIQNKLQDPTFEMPPIPDFDKRAFENEDIVEKGVTCRCMAKSRMDACKSVNPNKFAVTGPCMQNEYPGIYSKHCQAAKNAKAKVVSSNCASTFANVKIATCQCMEEKRLEWHKKFEQIKGVVNSATSAKQCGTDISNVLGSWLAKVEAAFNQCMPKSSNGQQQRDLHTLIELGCGQVVNGGVNKNELTVGFRFIRLFLDALNDRITVFCDKNCNF